MKTKMRPEARVLLVILFLNLAVALAKAIYGFTFGSLAVASDAIHSLVDGTSNVAGLIALRFSYRPPDEDHPYGHRKIEFVGSALIGMFIGMGAFEFGRAALGRLIRGGEPPEVHPAGLAVLTVTLGVNIFVARYEAKKGKELKSALLIADAAHTASDVAATVAVIFSQLLVMAGWIWADAAVAGGVLLLVLVVAVRIIRANVGVLIDRAIVDSKAVADVVGAVDGVRGCHRVRSRGSPGGAHLDLHLQVDPDLTVAAAHLISHSVEDRIRACFTEVSDVTIHIEPAGDPEEGL